MIKLITAAALTTSLVASVAFAAVPTQFVAQNNTTEYYSTMQITTLSGKQICSGDIFGLDLATAPGSKLPLPWTTSLGGILMLCGATSPKGTCSATIYVDTTKSSNLTSCAASDELMVNGSPVSASMDLATGDLTAALPAKAEVGSTSKYVTLNWSNTGGNATFTLGDA